jgi:uncharacterized protein with HEPN domain
MRQPEQPLGRRDPRVYLLDMQQAIDLVQVAVRGKTVAEYERDAILRSAVERQFITIGEALTQLLRLMPELQAMISHTRQIIAFRNILVHGYAVIAHDVVWAALQEDLLTLRREVDALLRELGNSEG